MKKYLKYLFLVVLIFLSVLFLITKKSIVQVEDSLKIKTAYPVFNNELDKEILSFITEAKNNFKKSYSNGYLNINYEVSIKYNITSVTMISYSYNSDKFDKQIKTYHYNTLENKFIKVEDVLKTDVESLLSVVSKYISSEVDLNDFLFLSSGFKLIAKNSNNTYDYDSVTIPYNELTEILKDDYLNLNSKGLVTHERDLSKYVNKKLIAFTFDDGPYNKTTLRLLDSIKKYDAKVTFFVLGSRANSNKESIIKAYSEGNEIGSHTYNHLNLLKLSKTFVKREINDTNDEIKNIIGVNPTVLRPPYGNTNDEIKSMSGVPTILWSIDTLDWKYKNANKICDTIVTKAYDGAIILLHDIYETSIDGALMAMEKLSKEGYAFVTISEMATLKNIKLDSSKAYYNFK